MPLCNGMGLTNYQPNAICDAQVMSLKLTLYKSYVSSNRAIVAALLRVMVGDLVSDPAREIIFGACVRLTDDQK